jgi:enoyl-CoA hydratase/carnithine racemase
MRALACSPIPIAAAITGHAPAGGTVVALFCDWRVAAQGEWKIGLNEVRVGLALPPVILSALRRQVGPRQAERLAAGGLLLSPAEAADIGLLDEVTAAEQVVQQALEWCRGLLSLPRSAMEVTRGQARADLRALFDREFDFERELEGVVAEWWRPEVQRELHAVVDRLRSKHR